MKLRAAFLACAAVSGGASAQPTAPATKITGFYSNCLASGGFPGQFDVAGSDTAVVFSATPGPNLVTITISPDAGTGLGVAVTRKGPSGTHSLKPGQSLTVTATEISLRHNFKQGEYCLRVQ